MKSPLFRLHESDEQRIARLLQTGSVLECTIEANYWLEYYCEEDCDLEPISTAMGLLERAQQLLEQL